MNKKELKEEVKDKYLSYVLYRCREDLFEIDKDPLLNILKVYGEN